MPKNDLDLVFYRSVYLPKNPNYRKDHEIPERPFKRHMVNRVTHGVFDMQSYKEEVRLKLEKYNNGPV